MSLRELIRLRIMKVLKREKNLLDQLVSMFDSLSDASIIIFLHDLWQLAVTVESWRHFLIDVLKLDEQKRIIVHYPEQLGNSSQYYHVVCNNINQIARVLDYLYMESWVHEVRIKVDHVGDSQEAIDYILQNPSYKDITINLYTNEEIANNPKILGK